jgi:hypothetical protein
MEKDYVGMSTCFYCGKPKEIMLDTRLRKTLPREACYNREPCDVCKRWMERGIILISVNEKLSTDHENPYRSGCWSVMKVDSFERIFKPMLSEELYNAMLKRRAAFITDEVWDAIGMPRTEIRSKTAASNANEEVV